MGKTVIVMRHGKAKRPSDGLDDINRELTEAGARALQATLHKSLALWPAGRSIEVWTSPATRARQTAALLDSALRERNIAAGCEPKVVDELWAGDKDAVLGQVRASDAEAIALVGHNPFSEELVLALTGSDIRFSTGALAAIDLCGESGQPDSGRLAWFAQGPVSQRWKTLVTMEKTLAEAADTVRRRYDAFFSDPADTETMHALRVSIRTARSLVAFVKPWQNGKQNGQIQEDLRAVARPTSRQRELDVMWAQVEADEGLSSELAAFCADQAAGERTATMKALSAKRMRERLDRACTNLHAIRWKRAFSEGGLDAAEVRSRFDRMADELRSDVEALDLADARRTHDVRKQAKRVRYSAERFKSVLGEDAIAVAKDTAARQDALGAICDARASIEIVNGLTAADLPAPVSWELALLRAKHETFLYTALRETRNA